MKIGAWRTHADEIKAFARDWDSHREELRAYTTTPSDYVAALAATGHPLRWEEIPTGITVEMASWAFANARYMRKRTSVADVLGFAGLWDRDLVATIIRTYEQLTKE